MGPLDEYAGLGEAYDRRKIYFLPKELFNTGDLVHPDITLENLPTLPETEITGETIDTGNANPSPAPVDNGSESRVVNHTIIERVRTLDYEPTLLSTGELFPSFVRGFYNSDNVKQRNDQFALGQEMTLEAGQFKANVPPNAIITGIRVRVDRREFSEISLPSSDTIPT
jgi:hypothetical protein